MIGHCRALKGIESTRHQHEQSCGFCLHELRWSVPYPNPDQGPCMTIRLVRIALAPVYIRCLCHAKGFKATYLDTLGCGPIDSHNQERPIV